MPRPNRRTLLDGYPLHILQRGHNKQPCFFSDSDHGLYLGLLQEYSKRHACPVHAYVLMTNHVHLLVTPPTVDAISRMMRSVNQIFGQHLNRKSNRCGSVWQGRFKSCLVDSREYFLLCQRYIENNPVRAGMVRAPSHYAWSSYGTNGEGRPSLLITAHERYQQLGRTDAARLATYRKLVETPLSAEVLSQIRTAIHRNRPLGGEDFVQMVDSIGADPADSPVPHLSQVPGPYLAPV